MEIMDFIDLLRNSKSKKDKKNLLQILNNNSEFIFIQNNAKTYKTFEGNCVIKGKKL
jgi:hypothetical protein